MANATLHITLNGKEMAVAKGYGVTDLIQEHALNTNEVALCINDTIVPRSQYGAVTFTDNDAVELVQFIGGG